MKRNIPFLMYTVLYTIINLMTLTAFPLIHSDEAWLAGLTRTFMKEGSVFVTESFFDLFPRTVHTIKVIYHLLQMPLIKIFGYEIFSVRLLSLIASILVLAVLYRLFLKAGLSHNHSFLAILMISTSVQFIYAGHFARQEMLLLLIFLS